MPFRRDIGTYDFDGFSQHELDQLNNIGATSISPTQWGYVGALNQGLTTTSNIHALTFTLQTSGSVWESSGASASIITGATNPGGTLTLRSTTDVAKGSILITETTPSIDQTSGALKVAGGIGVLGQITGGSSIVSYATTDATALGTGSLFTTGGASVSKSLYVGANLVFPVSGGYVSQSATGITIYGGDSANDDIAIYSTTNATKGTITIGDSATSGDIAINGGSIVLTSGTDTGADIVSTATNGVLKLHATGSSGGVYIQSDTANHVYITSGTTGRAYFQSTLEASAYNTAGVSISGGLGIAKKTYFHSNVYGNAFDSEDLGVISLGTNSSTVVISQSSGGAVYLRGLTLSIGPSMPTQIITSGGTTETTGSGTGAWQLAGGMYIAKTLYSGTAVHVGDASNYVEINPTNGMKFVGTSTTWDDLRVPLERTVVGPGASDAPTYTRIDRTDGTPARPYAYEFAGTTTNDRVSLSTQMPHCWKEGSTIYPHLHCVFGVDDPADNTTETVIFYLVYSWTNVDGTIADATSISKTYTISGTDAQYKHFIIDFDGIVGTGKTISSTFQAELYRDTSADTYAQPIHVIEFDIHYEIDTFGSQSATTK